MKILYIMGDCGSGVEQIGYVYALLLKKLGHTVPLAITQYMQDFEDLNRILTNYDCVVFNEPNENCIKIMKDSLKTIKNFQIVHSKIAKETPLNTVCLSLNYYLLNKINEKNNIIFPITYPFAFKKDASFNSRILYNTIFVGRYNRDKFSPILRDLMKKGNFKIDFGIISKKQDDEDSDINNVITEMRNNLTIDLIYEQLKYSKYLILPSTTECLSLVVGEAMVNGCIPVVLESKFVEHEQFGKYSNLFFNTHDMYDFILDTIDCDVSQHRKEMFNWANEKYSINKCLYELKQFFGTGKDGNILNLYNKEYSHKIPYKNAAIITDDFEEFEKCI